MSDAQVPRRRSMNPSPYPLPRGAREKKPTPSPSQGEGWGEGSDAWMSIRSKFLRQYLPGKTYGVLRKSGTPRVGIGVALVLLARIAELGGGIITPEGNVDHPDHIENRGNAVT